MTSRRDVGARKYVRVTGCRGNNLIEFDFAIGTPDLFVELILPEPAFAEFCRINEAVILPSGGDASASDPDEGDGALGWRLRDANAKARGD